MKQLVCVPIASVIRTKTRANCKHQIVTFQTYVVANTALTVALSVSKSHCSDTSANVATTKPPLLPVSGLGEQEWSLHELAIRIWHKQATETTHIGNEIATRRA
jgi:cytochrome c biogenesis factor